MSNHDSNKPSQLKDGGPRLVGFEECMARLAFPGSKYTFRRRINEMIKEFGGPIPTEPGHLSEDQFLEFSARLLDLARIRRERRRRL